MSGFFLRACQQACTLIARRCNDNQLQPQRTAVVMSRFFTPRLYKRHLRNEYLRPALKKRDKVYRLEEVEHRKPAGNMEVILTVDVEGIGFYGDVVIVPKKIGRWSLLPSGAGIYASPENLAKWDEIRKTEVTGPKRSVWAEQTRRKLESMNLPIGMHPKNRWTLNKTHVKVAFRKVGVEVPEYTITLPEEPITKPGNMKLQLLMNRVEVINVSATVFHLDPDEPDRLPSDLPPIWGHKKLSLDETIIEALDKQKRAARHKHS